MRLDGTGCRLSGYLSTVDDRIFIDDVSLSEAFRQFEGYRVFIELIRPDPVKTIEIDEKIRPLVDAINKAGYKTVGSCEGHMTVRYWGEFVKYPYVAYVEDGKAKVSLDVWLPGCWKIVDRGRVREIRPKREAATEEQLEGLQAQALALAETINKATS